ncbi:MAG TPA: hypothetical protein VN445_05115 [Rectinemataceae bacterium]|nr:hypothetical protein [Rectinemataceae bacterium]
MKKLGLHGTLQIGLALLLVALFPADIAAQDLKAWFAKPANQAAYGAIATEAQILAEAIKKASLSDSLIATRLEEAAKKRIPATVLIATLKEDTARYLIVSDALRLRDLQPKNEKQATAMVEQIALLLRAGIERNELGAALDAAVSKLGKVAGGKPAVSRAIAALSVVANARAEYVMSEEESLLLVITLVESDLSDKKMDSVLAFIKNVIAKGGSVSDALDAIVEQELKKKAADAKAKAKSEEKSKIKENQGNSGKSGK